MRQISSKNQREVDKNYCKLQTIVEHVIEVLRSSNLNQIVGNLILCNKVYCIH